MRRNWGLPTKEKAQAFRRAKNEQPLLTLLITVVFGIVGAGLAAVSFHDATAVLRGAFHGGNLITSVIAAGFGAWVYIWLARARFAAIFSPNNTAFSQLVRFFVRATFGLLALMILAKGAGVLVGAGLYSALLCVCGGAASAAAFQTVMAFVPQPQIGE